MLVADHAEPTTQATESGGRLTRNVYVVSIVSFFQDAASEMLYPVLPFFVTAVLGAPPAVLGAIEGLTSTPSTHS